MLARKKIYTHHDVYTQPTIEQSPKVPKYEKRYNSTLRRQVAILVLTTLFFAFLMVVRSDSFIKNGYKLGAMKKQEIELIKEIDYLEVQLAKAKAPERIIAIAEKNGMIAAQQNLYVSIAPVVAEVAEGSSGKEVAVNSGE